MAGQSGVPSGPPRSHWREAKTKVHDPAVLTIIAVIFFISAAGQALAQRYIGDDSGMAMAVLSLLGSAFLASAILIAARRDDRASGGRDGDRHSKKRP